MGLPWRQPTEHQAVPGTPSRATCVYADPSASPGGGVELWWRSVPIVLPCVLRSLLPSRSLGPSVCPWRDRAIVLRRHPKGRSRIEV